MDIIRRVSPGHYEVSDGREVIGMVYLTAKDPHMWTYWHKATDYDPAHDFVERQGAIDALIACHIRNGRTYEVAE